MPHTSADDLRTTPGRESGSFESGGDLPVPSDRDEMDAIERLRLSDVAHHLAGEVDTRGAVLVEGPDEWFGDGELGDL
jgi:hypothetical protein